MWHAWERTEKCIRFWWESPKETVCSEHQGVDKRMGSECILRRLAGGMGWIGFDWLRIGPVERCCEFSSEPWRSCTTEFVPSLLEVVFLEEK
jgi:hypothetical protein